MRQELEAMKDVKVLDEQVTIKSTMKEADVDQLNKLADAILLK
jgi:hypothetical protein